MSKAEPSSECELPYLSSIQPKHRSPVPLLRETFGIYGNICDNAKVKIRWNVLSEHGNGVWRSNVTRLAEIKRENMITDIPTPEEFRIESLNCLNLAWKISLDLYHEFEATEIVVWDTEGDVSDEFWEAAQHVLGNSITLVQQGQELALKGKIASVSPYLLISGPPTWPGGFATENTPFSQFRTINASDLIKVHDTVCSGRLGDSGRSHFENIRQLRNKIMHGVPKGQRMTLQDALRNIMDTYRYFLGGRFWLPERRRYLDRDTMAVALSTDYTVNILFNEFELVTNALDQKVCQDYVGHDPSQKSYLCPFCILDATDLHEYTYTAQFEQKESNDELICAICRRVIAHSRKTCPQQDCDGMYVCKEKGWNEVCLTCYS